MQMNFAMIMMNTIAEKRAYGISQSIVLNNNNRQPLAL